jgi:CorA-like Mg2+ transporter protein
LTDGSPDPIPLDAYRPLLDFTLIAGEQRRLLDGDKPFPEDTPGVVRIAAGNKASRKAAVSAGARPDSHVKLLVPAVDLDSTDVFEIELWFYTGEHPLVLLSGDQALPHPTLSHVLEVVQSELEEADWDAGRYLDLARNVKNMGLWILQQRTRRIEQSVRDALDDEVFSPADYFDLREYPARLARVERLASHLREQEPKVTSAEPESRYPVLANVDALDFFVKYVDEAANDAREAVTRLSGLISSQQIVLSQRQALDTARFQRVVTIIGTAVVVPGLVAAIFGANVGFQGRESSQAFWAMLLLMAGSGIGSYVVIRFLETGAWAWLTQRRPMSWFKGLSAVARLGVLSS